MWAAPMTQVLLVPEVICCCPLPQLPAHQLGPLLFLLGFPDSKKEEEEVCPPHFLFHSVPVLRFKKQREKDGALSGARLGTAYNSKSSENLLIIRGCFHFLDWPSSYLHTTSECLKIFLNFIRMRDEQLPSLLSQAPLPPLTFVFSEALFMMRLFFHSSVNLTGPFLLSWSVGLHFPCMP